MFFFLSLSLSLFIEAKISPFSIHTKIEMMMKNQWIGKCFPFFVVCMSECECSIGNHMLSVVCCRWTVARERDMF